MFLSADFADGHRCSLFQRMEGWSPRKSQWGTKSVARFLASLDQEDFLTQSQDRGRITLEFLEILVRSAPIPRRLRNEIKSLIYL